MYAIFETGGKQYKVSEGDIIFVEKLEVAEEEVITIDKVVAVGGENGINVGAPYVSGASVSAKVLKQGKDKKVVVFKMKSKKGYRKKQGHRQPYTKIQIEKISG